MTDVAIVSPGYPVMPGGVTDHTKRLAANWAAAGVGPLVVGEKVRNPKTTVRQWRTAGVSGVLLQYVPFLYTRFGVTRYPERLCRAARAHGLRTTVFVHEPWVPPSRIPWLVTSPLQKRQLRRLVHLADAVVTPVPDWVALLGPPTELMYVGTTLAASYAENRRTDGQTDSASPAPSPVVFSPFASGLNWDWILAAADTIGAPTRLTVVGAGAEEATGRVPADADRLAGWDWRGRLSATDALGLLAQARVVLAPFVDGLTGRRTSAMAALSLGARVVSSRGPLYDRVFDESPVYVAETKREFVDLARGAFEAGEAGSVEVADAEARTRRIEWYRERFDAAMLDAKLLSIVMGAA